MPSTLPLVGDRRTSFAPIEEQRIENASFRVRDIASPGLKATLHHQRQTAIIDLWKTVNIRKQPAVDPMPTRHRCDIRARLKALRQNSRPLLITPAHMARRPGDQLDAAIAFATVLMSVIMTVILHGDIRPIHGPLTMLSDAARFGRCDRRAAYDGISIEDFEANLEINLDRLHRELRDGTYQPQPVRRIEIPKRGAPGKTRPLGIPSVYDRVCQQAMVNRLEPIFEEVFDPSSFGYRKGRKTPDALSKIWREVEAGNEWIVDADLKDYFGPQRLLWVRGPRKAHGSRQEASRRWSGAEADSADAHGGLPEGGPPVRNSTGNPARRGHFAAVEQYPSHSL